MNSGYDLSYCETYISSILPFTAAAPSLGQSYADIIAILEQYIYLIGGLENAIGILEMAIDTQTIYNEWLAQDYFTAGLFTGQGVANAYYTVYAILKVYLPNL